MAIPPDRRPIVLLLELDGGAHRQERSEVARARPFVLIDECRIAGGFGLVAPGNDQRLQEVLRPLPAIQEPGALGRTQPLVQVRGVEVRTDRRRSSGTCPVCARRRRS